MRGSHLGFRDPVRERGEEPAQDAALLRGAEGRDAGGRRRGGLAGVPGGLAADRAHEGEDPPPARRAGGRGTPPGKGTADIPGGGTRGGEGEEETTPLFTLGEVTPLPAALWTNRPPEAVDLLVAYGAATKRYDLPADGWEFTILGAPALWVRVAADGTLCFEMGDGAPMSANLISPLRGKLGIAPPMGGGIWYAPTPSGGLIITFERAFLNRDSRYPVTFQVELNPGGSFAFRYALLDADTRDYTEALAGFTLGATLCGETQEWPLGPQGGNTRGGNGTRGGGTRGGNEPQLPEDILNNPGGVEAKFNGITIGLSIEQSHFCFHSPDPLTAKARVTPGGILDMPDLTVEWTYGNLKCKGSATVSLPRSKGWVTNTPDCVSVALKRDNGRTLASVSRPVWYCTCPNASTNPPPDEAEWEDEEGGEEGDEGGSGSELGAQFCQNCWVWWTPSYPGQGHGCPSGDPPPYNPGNGGEEEEDGDGQPEPYASYVRRGLVPEYKAMTTFPLEQRLVRFYPHGGPGGGECCPCPAHAAHHSGPATLVSFRSTSITLYRKDTGGNLLPLSVGSTVNKGEAVYVAGVAANYDPWVSTAVFEWATSTNTVVQTNAFTTLGVDIFADFDGNGTIASNDVARSISPPEGGVAVSVHTGIPRLLDLDAFVNLPGIRTLRLERVGNIPPWHTNNLNHICITDTGGAALLALKQTITNPPPQVLVQALAPGTAMLTYTFTGTGAASNLSCSATLLISTIGIECEPIFREAGPEGYLYNPCAVPVGGTARFKIRVLPEAFPDSRIVWDNYRPPCLSFPNGNTGRTVTVKGESEDDFYLAARIDGATPGQMFPYFLGKVLEPREIAIHFFIIHDVWGEPALDESLFDGWIAEANRAFRQYAVTFTKGPVTSVMDRPDWFKIFARDYQPMCNYTNNIGGLKVFCVREILSGAGAYGRPEGVVMSPDVKDRAFPHEIGHAFGLEDINEVYLGNELVSVERAGPLNWGGGGDGTGYYPKDLMQKMLIRRLLMYDDPYSETALDIPLGSVQGYGGKAQRDAKELRLRRVGLDEMNRNLLH